MQCKDKRHVRMLTSCIPDKDAIVKRRGKDKAVPLVIETYNNVMDGVDISDQMMSSYPLERKRLKKGQKMGLHLFNTCVFNSQILHPKRGGKLSALEFRSKLISQTIKKYGRYDTDAFQKVVEQAQLKIPLD